MTVKFHSNIANLMVGRGILPAGFNAPSGISIYSGTQPTAAQIVADWANYNSAKSNFLAHYSGAIWIQPLDGDAKFCSLDTIPAAVMPTNAGEAKWCIIWSSDVSSVSLASSVLPNNVFIVGEVTTLSASGIIRFNPDKSFVLGEAKIIADGVITAGVL